MTAPLLDAVGTTRARRPAFGVAGDAVARLLSGPDARSGPESYESHLARLGPPGHHGRRPDELRALVRDSGVLGRGGGEFPIARKLDLAATTLGTPVVVVNASEGEPASRKDAVLVGLRPHLVLDGAEAVASAVGADEILVYVHRERTAMCRSLERALLERRISDLDAVPARLVDGPDRYVAGEASAVVRFLSGGPAAPRRSALTPAASGVRNRPTVLSNAETYAHVALAARFGAQWFAEAGSPGCPGSTLVTLAGDVAVPGTVVEVVGPTTFSDALEACGGLVRPPQAVLVGGYEGSWLGGSVAWSAPLDRHALGHSGVRLGCGLVAVLAEERCGIAETARIVRWLAGETAGQCGPCALGLPAIASLLGALADGRARRSDVREIHRLAASVRGRGACGHPTGVSEVVESALDTFSEELHRHVRGRACHASGAGLPLPLAAAEGSRR
ncbi:MAG: hypothetical protein M0Z33_04315 [Actinomycetota bacterium]|nr:hypothetical protein [Actinomycetota bacterium]